jgi:hypothetical protein
VNARHTLPALLAAPDGRQHSLDRTCARSQDQKGNRRVGKGGGKPNPPAPACTLYQSAEQALRSNPESSGELQIQATRFTRPSQSARLTPSPSRPTSSVPAPVRQPAPPEFTGLTSAPRPRSRRAGRTATSQGGLGSERSRKASHPRPPRVSARQPARGSALARSRSAFTAAQR